MVSEPEDEMQNNSIQQKRLEEDLKVNDLLSKLLKEYEQMKMEVLDKLNRNSIGIIEVPATQEENN